jgi:SagB-type dehydrogenase family enzyme
MPPGVGLDEELTKLADRAAVRRFRAARVALPERQWESTATVKLPPPAPASSDPSLDAVVRRRRSTRHFAQRPISAAELGAALQLSTRGAPADFLASRPTLLDTYVIVNSVEGIEPGAYYYDRKQHRLDLLRSGNFRRAAGFLCLDQALARDASAVLFHMANLNALALAFGERGYRLAELEAGLASGRVYLAAYAVGRGATGLTFFDDQVTRFFSPHATALEPLLVTALGVPSRSLATKRRN